MKKLVNSGEKTEKDNDEQELRIFFFFSIKSKVWILLNTHMVYIIFRQRSER